MDKGYMSRAEKDEAAKRKMTVKDAINFYNNLRKQEIYDFLTHGFNKGDIRKYYLSVGINMSEQTISRLAKAVFDENNQSVPINLYRYDKIISIEEILEYRKQGLSYAKIQNIYNEKGIGITASTISRMVIRHMQKEKGLKELDNELNELLNEKIKSEKRVKVVEATEKTRNELELDEK